MAVLLAACRPPGELSKPYSPELDSGRALLLAGQASEARHTFRQLSKTAEASGDRQLASWAHLGIGDATSLLGQWHEVEAAFEAAGGANPLIAPRQQWLEGRAALNSGDLETADRVLRRALASSEQLGDDWLWTRVLALLSEAVDEGRAREAFLPNLLAAAERARASGDQAGRAELLAAAGRLFLGLGELPRAAELLVEARQLGATLDAPSLTSRVHQDLGILHTQSGDLGAALSSFRAAAELAQDRPRILAMCLANVGAVYHEMGDYPEARQSLEEALETFEQVGDRNGQLWVLQSLGTLSIAADQLDLARGYFERILPLIESLFDRAAQATTWINLGHLELAAGDDDRAQEAFEKGLELSADGGGQEALYARFGLGQVLLRRGDAESAQALGEVVATSELPRARLLGQLLTAQALRLAGQLDQALTRLLETVDLSHELMAQAAGGGLGEELFLDHHSELFHTLADLQVQRGEVTLALAWSERIKARSLLEALADGAEQESGRVETRSPPSPVVDPLGALGKTRQSVLGWTVDQLGDWPPPGTLALEFLVLDEKLLLFVIESGGEGQAARVHPVEIPVSASELARSVESLRRRLAERGPGGEGVARHLYDLLLAPVEPYLADVDRLSIVPDGPLWDLPWLVLAAADDRLLIDRVSIFSAPSLSYLMALRGLRQAPGTRRSSTPGSLLVVGDPAPLTDLAPGLGKQRQALALAPLPDARREARAIAALYGARQLVLLGDQATESRVRAAAGSYRILHFATHALLDPRRPSASALLLAASAEGDDDGLLDGREIATLQLDADLVILAGCQTLRGRPVSASGLRGLSRAFAVAGSPAVIGSRWEVDSVATTELMIALHRHLLAGADKAEALRLAALEVRQQQRFRQPFYWAGFTLVGDPR